MNDFHAGPQLVPVGKDGSRHEEDVRRRAVGPGFRLLRGSGNDKVGEGRMTIEKSDKPSLVAIKLEFLKPFAATNTATFTFAPAGDGTKVTWAMDGNNNFISKAFQLFMDMDKMIGKDFEQGLANMKTAAESAPKPSANVVQ